MIGLTIGDVAQLVEHMVCNHGVAGSNPVVSTRWVSVSGVRRRPLGVVALAGSGRK